MSEQMFEPSSGGTVVEEPHGLRITNPNLYQRFINNDTAAVLREYFQQERDQELGRWRDPAYYPLLVMYAIGVDDVRVLDEVSGDSYLINRAETENPSENWSFIVGAAKRYFEEHPKPVVEPWENALPGEVWVLTVDGQDQVYRCGQNGLYGLADGQPLRALPGMFVTGGRRIWPEQEITDE